MEIHGADIETVKGDLKLLCTEDRQCEPTSFEELATFLLYGKGTKLYWTFNLQFDSEGMIKLLPQDIWQELYDNNVIIYKNFKITSFPKKLFQIGRIDNKGRTGNTAKLYDVAQYYQGMNLDSASLKYLKKQKLRGEDDENIGAELGKETAPQYYRDNRDMIIMYCKNDSYLTMELGKHIMAKFDELGFPTTNPISCATISAKYVLKHQSYPRIDVLPEGFHRMAQESFRGGMFQTLQRGLFEQPLYDYDINSAYPSVMVTLPHWANGKFTEVTKATNAPYGWYFCEFDCPMIPYDSKNNWSFTQKIQEMELVFEASNHRIYYPTGTRQQIITKAEYEWLRKYNYPVDLIIGSEWNQEKREHTSPFNWMENFYYERRKQKKAGNYSIQYAMKIILNGLYGKTAEQKHGIGKLSNFFYASYITAKTRLQLATLLHKNPGVIVNIATDGLVSTKKLTGVKISDKLGDWEYNEYTKGLFLGSGMYQVWTEDGNFSTKARGVTENRSWDMLKAFRKNKNKDYLEFLKTRPLHLGEILAHHKKLKKEWLNVFMPISKKMRVNTDQNHNWSRTYKDFDDLLRHKSTGKPLSVEEILK